MTLQKRPSRRALVVDRDRGRSDTIRHFLEDGGLEVVERHTLRGALSVLRERAGVEAVLLDVALSKEPGFSPLDQILGMAPTLPVVLLAEDLDEDITLEAVRSGAQGYLLARHLHPTLVQRTVSHAVAIRRAQGEVQFAESMLLDSETRYRSLLDLSRDAICVVDVDGVVIQANEAAYELLGSSAKDILGRRAEDFLAAEDDRVRVRAALEERQPLRSFETTAQRSDGGTSHILLTLVPRGNPLGEFRGFYLLVWDAGAVEGTYPKEGLYDGLTGLPNRALFLDRLNRVIARQSRHEDLLFAVLFIDLDGFKQVNDTLGHLPGDELLLQAGGRLAACVRDGDTVARMGGDEFVVLLGEIDDIEDATLIADRLIEGLGRPFRLGESEVRISCSVGITLGSEQVTLPAELLRQADHAMYQAKNRQRGTYQIYDRTMQTRVIDALRLDEEVRGALLRQELTVLYQPVVEARTGRVESFVALVGWLHPERGLIAAADFLPTAQKLGLSHAVSAWLVFEVCRQLREWRDRYPASGAAVVSVPFSAAEFLRPDFVSEVEAAVREHEIPPALLRLELTERALSLDPEATLATLARLQEQGFRVEVVDFAMGSSSWLALEPTPVDRLRIRRSDLESDPDGDEGSAMRRIVRIARCLEMKTETEGVDTEPQRIQVRNAGSNLARGLLFHGPLAAAEAGALLAERSDHPTEA